jgi:hypothetical protein
MRLRPPSALLLGIVLAPGCGDDTQQDTPPPAKVPPPSASASAGDTDAAPPAAKLDVGPEEIWADTDDAIPDEGDTEHPGDDGGEEPAAEPTAFPGPCTVKWSTGSVLRFTYDQGKGTVRVDEDGNGKVETCASFELDGEHTSKLQIDEGCNKKFETTIEPTYDGKTNVATATVKTGKDESEVTLVILPGYVGLTPGYLLQAPKSKVKLKSSKGRVRSASVAKPAEGPAMSVTFTYTKEGRVRAIKEDIGADGTVDRELGYRYDELGNATRLSVTLKNGDAEEKGTARLSYSCHQPPPAPEPPKNDGAPAKK